VQPRISTDQLFHAVTLNAALLSGTNMFSVRLYLLGVVPLARELGRLGDKMYQQSGSLWGQHYMFISNSPMRVVTTIKT